MCRPPFPPFLFAASDMITDDLGRGTKRRAEGTMDRVSPPRLCRRGREGKDHFAGMGGGRHGSVQIRRERRERCLKRHFKKGNSGRYVLYCTVLGTFGACESTLCTSLVKTKADGKTLLQYSSLSSNHAFVARRGCPLSHCCSAQRAAAVIIVPDINSRCGIGFPSELGEEKDRRRGQSRRTLFGLQEKRDRRARVVEDASYTAGVQRRTPPSLPHACDTADRPSVLGRPPCIHGQG